ncbi:DnaJ family domain-containing protein [Streptomyces brevispora]|uniref:DnaJ family domain-containing protein n=1 Tax=Streptomyces brevispora TaxID=887462 RepID=UPI00380F4D87
MDDQGLSRAQIYGQSSWLVRGAVCGNLWIWKQIRESEQRGDFSQLPGFGKPLDGLDRPYDDTWWIKAKLQREGVSVLPPTLALRKEAEDTLAALPGVRTEAEVRRMLTEVNEKIAEAIRRPPPGPLLNLKPFDVDALAGEWRAARDSS